MNAWQWLRYPLVFARVAWRNWRANAAARAVRNERLTWRCVRDGGGGILTTPKPMSEENAIGWLCRVTGGEVFYVDRERRHLFYRSAAQLRQFRGGDDD